MDVETDNDILFKLFLPVPGVHTSLVPSSALSGLHQHLSQGSPIYPILAEICAEDEPEEEAEEFEEVPELRKPWYIRIIQYIKGVFLND
ncbi:hypothetical protein JCM10914_4421 [Paenibacillus sp. JCM 10914]|nr:hypothetical protein JCM10914_4421 [Paenibacillus sp. JCM 10914]